MSGVGDDGRHASNVRPHQSLALPDVGYSAIDGCDV